MGDKIKNKADELLGKGKETAGETATTTSSAARVRPTRPRPE